MTAFKDLQGLTFGRLTVEARAENSPAGKARWCCLCQCGTRTVVTSGAIVNGHISSCGCLKREKITQLHTTHGMTHTPEYVIWKAMWARCTNPSNKKYLEYKDRRPPEVWRDFAVFYAEIGPRPSPAHSLDRLKNDLPYGPGNVRWATPIEQSANRGSFILRVDLGGEELSFTEACRRVGLKANAAFSRWYKTHDMQKASLGHFKLAGKVENDVLL